MYICVDPLVRIWQVFVNWLFLGTNDAYVMIQLGKEKYQTSVKDKTDAPQWYEECDL